MPTFSCMGTRFDWSMYLRMFTEESTNWIQSQKFIKSSFFSTGSQIPVWSSHRMIIDQLYLLPGWWHTFFNYFIVFDANNTSAFLSNQFSVNKQGFHKGKTKECGTHNKTQAEKCTFSEDPATSKGAQGSFRLQAVKQQPLVTYGKLLLKPKGSFKSIVWYGFGVRVSAVQRLKNPH